MSQQDKLRLLRQTLRDIRALLADLKQWSHDADKIADLETAIEQVDGAIKVTA